MLALRDETIGTDLAAYERYFTEYADKTFVEVFDLTRDPLYWLLTWAISRVIGDFRWFIVIMAALILFPIAKVYCKDREHGYLKLLLFVNLPTFVMIFSGLRQAIAISLGLERSAVFIRLW